MEDETAEGISFPGQKYYDTYLYGEDKTNYIRRILKDATGEMGPFSISDISLEKGLWYHDNASFITNNNPFIMREGVYTIGFLTGIFSFNAADGKNVSHETYRLVLAI